VFSQLSTAETVVSIVQAVKSVTHYPKTQDSDKKCQFWTRANAILAREMRNNRAKPSWPRCCSLY